MKNKITLIVLIAGLGASLLFFGCSSTKAASDEAVAALEQRVSELDKTFNVDARKYVSVYFELSDAYKSRGEDNKAYEAATKGLRLDSLNMDMQCRAAEYEVANANYDLAYPRLAAILEKSDDKKLVALAQSLMDKIPQSYKDAAVNLFVTPMYEKTLLVVFYPGVEDVYKTAITQRIQQEYKLTVITQELDIEESKKNIRDSYSDFLSETLENLILGNSPEALANTLAYLGIAFDDLEDNETKEFFVKNVFLNSGYTEADWEQLKAQYEMQYDANELIVQVLDNCTTESDCLGILGVTGKDIYSGSPNNNFLFGLSSENVSVMSVNRFIKGETDKVLAAKRAIMQAFSSTGYIIGIPRCSTPLCARAYPNSLAEQDMKNDVLCPSCVQSINEVYASLK
ncbi:MAG: hypothetical protein K5907_06310 [Treponema sp.]|nr:hypothetical protein [Treponema sp.]